MAFALAWDSLVTFNQNVKTRTFGMLALFIIGFAVLGTAVKAAQMTNDDVIKLVNAKLDDSLIITAIENAEPKFDTSAQGLIELSNAKVSQPIITAIIKKSAGSDAAAKPVTQPNDAVAANNLIKPSDVLMIDNSQTKVMKYLNPQMRAAARAFGFGGFATYSVLRGSAAALRVTNKSPAFLISVPDQAQPESYFTLASLAVRENGSREVMVGGGYMSYSTGITDDRVVAVQDEKTADQSRAEKGFTIYKITPKAPLVVGEYAVVLYTGEMQGVVGAWFTGTGNSYFDFGVDP
jgi:hypothetical protein